MLIPENLFPIECLAPEPVTSAVVTSSSETTNSVTLTVTFPTDVNDNSVLTVVPICDNTRESEQTITCTGDSSDQCEVTGLTSGCSYTFELKMMCEADILKEYSTALEVGSCIG